MIEIKIETVKFGYFEFYDGVFGKYCVTFEICLFPILVGEFNLFTYFEKNNYIIENKTITAYQSTKKFNKKIYYNFYGLKETN